LAASSASTDVVKKTPRGVVAMGSGFEEHSPGQASARRNVPAVVPSLDRNSIPSSRVLAAKIAYRPKWANRSGFELRSSNDGLMSLTRYGWAERGERLERGEERDESAHDETPNRRNLGITGAASIYNGAPHESVTAGLCSCGLRT
jgi:hypothetical protein